MADILPPFTHESATRKVKAAQALWNTQDPARIALAYTSSSVWRNRSTFLHGHAAITSFLTDKWRRETRYRLRKELFAFTENRIAVQFWYEFYEEPKEGGQEEGQWWRCYGLEDWTFADDGRMEKRMMSGNDVRIEEKERWFGEGVGDVDGVEIGGEHW
ncbi:hypothetical protein EDC01DRAFT_756482 [Geopyxis carbonaria]|nr:hypothetical protein EDC01DRAFT_756482 [Geopyxis carbonaria]